MEEWKDVVGYEEFFKVSSTGQLFSKRTNKILKQTTNKNGYASISTRFGGRSGTMKCFRMHRVVAEAFIPNDENKPEVNHIDGNKLNNCVSNLEWATGSENVKHAYATNLITPLRGVHNKSSKLTLEQVDEIRKRRLEGETYQSLADCFGIHRKHISRVCRHISYK